MSIQDYPCDLCGANEAVEVPHARLYTNDQPIHICRQCGFVYVKSRRDSQTIADAWSTDLYGRHYVTRIPAVKARQTYVADLLDSEIRLRGRRLYDIGAGEGQFLKILSQGYGASVFGIEPSPHNCQLLKEMGLECFQGTAELYANHPSFAAGQADVVTVVWTLENCHDCRALLRVAHDLLKPDGTICVATGSRLLVPFKKPLQLYLSAEPADTHCFRFSRNTLSGLLLSTGFEPVTVNRFLDSDVLCILAQKRGQTSDSSWKGDDFLAVYDFFDRWHRESVRYADGPGLLGGNGT